MDDKPDPQTIMAKVVVVAVSLAMVRDII